ncbi:MAG: aminopeptidase P family protein [Candidatus Thorarchaeota archaeon]|nr:aminopeptidase P family protein [Candidatus Thorarchaeota archaeon]
MLDESVYKKRIEQVQKHLESSSVDFAFLTQSPNFQYLAGFENDMRERLLALVIRQDAEPQIVAPAFEVSAHTFHTWIKDLVPWAEDEDPYALVAELVGEKSGGHSIFLDDDTPLGVYWALETAFGGFAETASLSPMINSMRIIKSDKEIELMKKAGHIINDAVLKAFKEVKIGMTEQEVQLIVHKEIRRQEATPTFAAIQFGENSALPHAEAGSRELKKGDVVFMDCGCKLEGYNTDMTRVGVVGPPTEELERVFSTVLHALETAFENIAPRMACGAADGLARRVIDDTGYGDYFTHRLGHGIGLEIHEPPYIVRGSSQELQAGMCHSIEPGIYLEGKFGIRIEDLVCIREDGPELLTFTPRDLIQIDP